jgi:hypothetical protein
MAAVLGPGAAAGPNEIPRLLPADTESFLYLDVRQFLRSALVRKHLERALKETKGLRQEIRASGIEDLLTKAGLNLLGDIDKVVLCAAAVEDVQSRIATSGSTLSFFGVATGKFDVEKLTAAAAELGAARKELVWSAGGHVARLQLAVVSETEHQLLHATLKIDESQILDCQGTVIDGKYLVFGSKTEVEGARSRVQRRAAPVVRGKEVADYLARMDPSTVGSFRGDRSILKSLPGIDDPGTDRLIQKIARLRLDCRVATGVKLVLILEMTDAAAARELKPVVGKLAERLQAVIALLGLRDPRAQPLAEVGQNLTITVRGKTITAQTALSGPGIDALIKAAK